MAIFSPSMMCARYRNLEQEIQDLELAGADRLHLDVMDGRFVPNFALGLNDVKCICELARIETELHLMVEQPSLSIRFFAETKVNTIYIHPESDYHPTTAIQQILEMGKTPGIVLNPGTSIESVIELLNIVNKVIVMGVNPGHAGQLYLPYVDNKIDKLLKIKDAYDLELIIDGACSAERIKKWNHSGVDGYILGTSALFDKPDTYQETISALRGICEENDE